MLGLMPMDRETVAHVPASPARPRKIWMFRLVAVGLGCVVACVFLETAVRMSLAVRPDDLEALRRFEHAKRTSRELKMIHFVRLSPDPRMIYEMVPNIEGTFHGAPLRTNSAGFADRERIRIKPAGTYRLAVIGDSIAFGWGVAPEDRYSDVLEKFLNDTTSATRYEVLNFGVPGYNTVMEAALLESRALAYEPDAIILGYCADNDTSLPNFVRKPRDLYTLSHSYLWEIVRSRSVTPARLRLEGGVEYSDPANVPPEYSFLVGWDNARRAFQRIADIAKRRKIPVVFLRDYYYLEPYRDHVTTRVQDIGEPADALARELGFVVVRPVEALVRFLDEQGFHSFALSVDPDHGDAHPNPVRHALLARELYRALVEHEILPDASARRTRLSSDLNRWNAIIERAMAKSKIPEKYRQAKNNTLEEALHRASRP